MTLVYHPLTDLSADGKSVRFTTSHGTMMPPPLSTYALELEESAAESPCSEFEPKKFTLSLAQGERRKVLQRDAKLPRSRKCAYRYRIEKVISHEQSLAVFLLVFKPGFEGPDVRHMVVTGTFEL